ncbi:hypothetical protein AVEN_198183-1 [Araneus ventricosus]|uniref:Uncharacterized protein n=1 Tax=Araneus ventricosus TaxID=182803 RepID=A0A4Y2WXR5_ARAVE|nr:hypothetical protein AVEN_198183-1 [Araneus ventricosus]
MFIIQYPPLDIGMFGWEPKGPQFYPRTASVVTRTLCNASSTDQRLLTDAFKQKPDKYSPCQLRQYENRTGDLWVPSRTSWPLDKRNSQCPETDIGL